jgi:NhaP-type Na+/H+ or K+/H+ antiporter
MLVGLVVGVVLSLHENVYGESLSESIRHWASVSPEVILFTILPILLFESAFSSDVHIMRHEAPQIFALAVPGVILQAAMMAVYSKYTFNYGDHWDWYTALMFGSMMSATDPVAVVALVKELGMNARIGTLIEGEGLMNDGSAIVLFNVFRVAITSENGLTPGGVIGTAFRLSLGGPIVGIAIGAATSACLAYFTYNDLQSEVTLTIVGCYGCFLVAEGTPLAVSGVLAVVFCGLYLSFYGRGNISVKVEHSLHAFWHMAEYIADTLIFFVAGVVMASKMLADDIVAADWLNLFLFFIACQAIRAINILACWPVLQQGYGVSWQEGVFLVFGGLRGAIGLSLALVVESEISSEFLETRLKNKIVFLMSGMAFLSLIINGTLILPLVKFLKLDRVSEAETEMFDHTCLVIERHLEHFVESDLKSDKFLGDADYALVWRYIPVMSAQQYWHRVQSNKIILSRKEKETMRAICIADHQVFE